MSKTNIHSSSMSVRPVPHIVPTARVTAGLHHQAQTRSISESRPSIISSPTVPPTSPSYLSDNQLLILCAQYGTQAKVWKQRFLGLLPEVERRQLYVKEGCFSIFEFAAKLGGVSKEQVQRVLQLEKRFEFMPVLQQALTSGEVTVHKLARIASVATLENQEFLLHQSKLLSKTALETLVKDTKKSVPGHSQKPNKTEKIAQFDELGLSSEIRNRLLSLRNKGIDINKMLRKLLNQREEEIKQEKQRIARELVEQYHKNEMAGAPTQPSRYIPAKVKHLLKQEYGEKCAHEQCINKAHTIHHTRRFGLSPNHNPLFLAPLCKQHHEIAHSIDMRVQGYKRGDG